MRRIILFWLPLAATWFMMALELPYIAAIVARMPEAARGLAAFGVATSLAWLIESPIMMLLSASAALVRDRASFFALRRFATILNVGVTIAMATLALPPVFRIVAHLIGLPDDIAHHANMATAVLILWPASIGVRRFYQGILVRHHLTRRVAYGTVVRLVSMSVTAALLAFTLRPAGAVLGACALLAGVMMEALASRWMARHIVQQIVDSDDVAAGTLLELRSIARFYFPLALTSILSMAIGPLVTFGLGRGRFPIESLAIWPVINSMIFLFRSGGVAYQEVGIALGPNHDTRRAAFVLGTCASAVLALFALTPLEDFWFRNLSGLSAHLAAFAAWPMRILILYPFLEYVLSFQRAHWIVGHRTRVVSNATAIEASILAITLLLCVGQLNLVGAVAGAIALLCGRLCANAYLLIAARTR